MVRDETGRPAYVWPLHKGYDIFTADLDGKNLLQITKADRYDAEATICPMTVLPAKGSSSVWTPMRCERPAARTTAQIMAAPSYSRARG